MKVPAVRALCVKARNSHIWSRRWSGMWEHSPHSFKTVTHSAKQADTGSGADVTQEGTGGSGNSLSILHLGKFQRCCLCGNSWIMLQELPSTWLIRARQNLLSSPPSAVVQEKAVNKENWHRAKLSTQIKLKCFFSGIEYLNIFKDVFASCFISLLATFYQ